MDHASFADFITYTFSQKEVSLAIAKDNQELSEFVTHLEEEEFRQAVDALELLEKVGHASKTFLIVRDKLTKDVYDFIVQYPSGQVEIYDKHKLKSRVLSPIYKDVSVVIIATREALQNAEKEGFQILSNIGMTYQS